MIKIIVVANKFKHFTPAKEFFEKLLKNKKVKIEMLFPSKKPFPSNIQEESAKIIKLLQKHPFYFKILLSEEGSQFTSVQFASQVIDKHQDIVFVVWGARGVDQEMLREHINLKLSLSTLTFNHILATIVLLEQIYRSFNILKGWSYHH